MLQCSVLIVLRYRCRENMDVVRTLMPLISRSTRGAWKNLYLFILFRKLLVVIRLLFLPGPLFL